MTLGGFREVLREIVVSIVRIGLAETKHFSEGYDAIFSKKKSAQAKKPAAAKSAAAKKTKKTKKK
jgi:hypothetical protein